MAKRSNSEGRQYIYQKMTEGCNSFTLGMLDADVKIVWGKTFYVAFTIDISEYDLTDDEKVEAYYIFRNDNPQYFWLSNQIIYSTNSITVLTYDVYADGAIRQSTLQEIIDTVRNVYQSQISSQDSRYEKVLKLHDVLIGDVEYASDVSGEITHSIAGALTSEKSATCEGYSKVMQLMLNCYGISNIYVKGDAGGPHSWNLIYMNAGNWSWLDATWDDQVYEEFRHSYFFGGKR